MATFMIVNAVYLVHDNTHHIDNLSASVSSKVPIAQFDGTLAHGQCVRRTA